MLTISICIVCLYQLREIQSLVILANILILDSHCIKYRRNQVQILGLVQSTIVSRVQVVILVSEVLCTSVRLTCETVFITSLCVRQYQVCDSCLVNSCVIWSYSCILVSLLVSIFCLCSKYCDVRIVLYALNLVRIIELQCNVELTCNLILCKALNTDACSRSTS